MSESVGSDRLVCFCRSVTEKAIIGAVREGACTLQDIQRMTGGCTGKDCARLHPEGRCCAPDILALLERELGKRTGDGCG